ncbi:MAG: hypothetical protein M3552_17190 [Planctomycetota bacterium]|nr:hypothetical protein [Planctomycetota bacterium]
MDRDADGDLLRQRLFRSLLYGAPIVAAFMMLATCRLIIEAPVSPDWLKYLGIAFALLAAFGSAAGAFGLRNRLAWRVAHSTAAAVVSVAVYAIVLTAMSAVMAW